MFINQLQIKNFKCFDDDVKSLDFNIPNGETLGSELNIFVGDNNSGKSTIFEGVDFLRDNTKKDLKVHYLILNKLYKLIYSIQS